MKINLDSYSRADLQALIADARKRLKKQIVTEEQRAILTRVKAELAAAGLTLAALKLRRPAKAKLAQTFFKGPVTNPLTGATWQLGVGRPPAWAVEQRQKQDAHAADSVL